MYIISMSNVISDYTVFILIIVYNIYYHVTPRIKIGIIPNTTVLCIITKT